MTLANSLDGLWMKGEDLNVVLSVLDISRGMPGRRVLLMFLISFVKLWFVGCSIYW